MTFKYFLIYLCYVKGQNILANVLVLLLEHPSFRLICPSILLSKFASQLKLIQSVVRVGISHKFNSQGPALRILSLRIASHNSKGSSSRVIGVRVSCPRVLIPRSYGPKVPGLRVLNVHIYPC